MNFITEKFNFEYNESDIKEPVLWENHCHGQYEMIGVVNGDINIMLEGRKYRLTENQVAIIPPLSYHTITANKQGGYKRITALFDVGAIPAEIQSFFLDEKEDVFITTSVHLKGLKNVCVKTENTMYAPLAEALMTMVFYENINKQRSDAETETDDFLKMSLGYIEQHLNEKVALDELAKYTMRSKSSFCHLFEEKMKITPKQYILQKKLALANKLIMEGTPPTVAATRVGYENYSNFYRMYVKYYGVRPGGNL